MTIAFVFILGLFVGSFLNVVVYRLHRAESFIRGFSKCLFCSHRLYPKDLFPLFSLLWLRGKCRYCRHKISGQYFWAELATGLSFTLIFWYIFAELDINAFLLQLNWFTGLQLIGWWVFTSFLIIIFIYDLRYYLILDKVSLPAVAVAFIINIFLGHSWTSLLLAMLVGGGFFLAQFVLSKGKWIGGGDIRLGLLMGAILGWTGVLLGLFVAYMLGGVFASILLLSKKKHLGDKLPFGTFLTIATFIVLLYGDILFKWYISLW